MSNKKALIAMSGGVDSSVAAYLMQQAGFDCVGGTMLLTDCIPGADCHAEENIRRASAVAKRLGIPFHVFSFSREFRQYVMEPFVSCYESGGTPNPCVECNKHLKFRLLLDKAIELGCDYIVTGHYVKIQKDPDTGRYLAKCVAWQIAEGTVPEIGEKDRIWLPMPMIKDKEKLKAIHDRDAEALTELLDAGKDVAFLTLGDPTVYSTCMYVHKRLKRMGYETRIVPGIPSFCAAAARMDVPLAENRQEIHILPASYDIENSLELSGTKVLMKAGRKMADVKRLLDEKGLDAMMVENCGMEEERIYLSTGDIPEEAGYYSLLVVKEKNGRGGERA